MSAPHKAPVSPSEVVAALFPAGVVSVVAVCQGASGAEPAPLVGLAEAERTQVAGAGAKRQREFAAGRRAAREALARLGIGDFPLLNDADRAPVWPAGIVGSITHCKGLCAVAVASETLARSLGLDAEGAAPLSPRLVDRICTPAESDRLAGLPRTPGLDWAKLTFSAKESVYKCYFPLARRVIGFRDVEINFGAGDGRFEARLLGADADGADAARRFQGRFDVDAHFVYTAVTLAAGPREPGPAIGSEAV